MARSVADLIAEANDVQPVRNDWLHLISPLSQAMALPVDSAPLELYIDTVENRGALPVTYFGTGVVHDLPDDWPGRLNTMMQAHGRPLVLLGDPGVGKTAWISRFVAHIRDKRDISFVHYDHHRHEGWPVARFLPEAERVLGHLVTELLETTKASLRAYGLTGDLVLGYDEDEILRDPSHNITNRFWNTLQTSVEAMSDEFGHTLFLFIDNLDLYATDIQTVGIAFACHIASWKGVRAVISLRPPTYDTLDLSRTELRNPRVYTIIPVPVSSMIRNRLGYVWSTPAGNKHVQQVLGTLKDVTLDLRWAKDQTATPEKLKSVHERVVGQLTDSEDFGVAIRDLHNFNMREIVEVIKQLLESQYFSEAILSAMSGDVEKATPEDLITAYLRGPYKRHRGRTRQYWVRPMNIFDVPGVQNRYLLVGVRALQWISKWPSSGEGARTVEAWREALTRYGYAELDVTRAIVYLAQSELTFDIKRQLNWRHLSESDLARDDKFVASPAGRFVLDKMLGRYAFRYAEAMADVIRRGRTDGRPWEQGKNREAMIRNALGIVELVLEAARQELRSVEEAAKVAGSSEGEPGRKFLSEFGGGDVAGEEFLVGFTKECCRRAKTLQRRQEAEADFPSARRLKTFMDQAIPVLLRRAAALGQGQAPAEW